MVYQSCISYSGIDYGVDIELNYRGVRTFRRSPFA